MKKIIVWDLPIRLFHWAFAGSLTVSLTIGFLADDDSLVFQYHMLFGLIAAFTLVVRLILGVAGSRHNRFSAFPLGPADLVRYAVGTFTGKARRYVAHNPGAAVAAILMFVLVPLLVASGTGWLDEDLHEGLAIALLVVVGAHISGIIWHTIRHRESIAMSMVTGRKEGPVEDGLESAKPTSAVAILLAGAAWITALFANHDNRADTVKVPLIGTTLHLGENEDEEDEHGGHDDDDDDDDDD
jgi:cytochrome b